MKYELVKETYRYRIKALKDFGDVKAGELGGLVSGTHNLSQEGFAGFLTTAPSQMTPELKTTPLLAKVRYSPTGRQLRAGAESRTPA